MCYFNSGAGPRTSSTAVVYLSPTRGTGMPASMTRGGAILCGFRISVSPSTCFALNMALISILKSSPRARLTLSTASSDGFLIGRFSFQEGVQYEVSLIDCGLQIDALGTLLELKIGQRLDLIVRCAGHLARSPSMHIGGCGYSCMTVALPMLPLSSATEMVLVPAFVALW